MKLQRHAAILDLVRCNRVPSQDVLRELLARRGIEVTQTTLSRDIRELGLVKAPNPDGGSTYSVPPHISDPTPALRRLLPSLYLGSEGSGNLLIIKTLIGGAQPIAVAIDYEDWPEVMGTIAGDDTILLILRGTNLRARVTSRLDELAGL